MIFKEKFDNTLGFIGAGNMGLAIMSGVLRGCKLPAVAFDVNAGNCDAARETGGIIADSASDVVKKSKYVVLAVKPQSLTDVLDEIKSSVTDENVIVSICAGISDKYIKNVIPQARVVLVMPNTAIMTGFGAAAVSRGENVTADEFDFVKNVFAQLGIAKEVPIDKMCEVIAVNGSSPAYLYYYAQIVTRYARDNGISEESALPLFAQTLIGAGKMLLESGKSPEELIAQVSSKGGTTVAGLENLRSGGFEDVITSCCNATLRSAIELGK